MNAIPLCALLVAFIPARPSIESEPQRPNILLIIADDLGTDMLRPYKIGKDIPKTPNLDALAESSVLFRNAWSSPMCSPTRACIQTGRLGMRTGIGELVKDTPAYDGLAASEIIIPELLDSATDKAYEHAYFGKWHLNHISAPDASGAPRGPDVARIQGYNHHEGTIHNIKGRNSYFNWPKVSNGVITKSTVYATTATVDDFLAWKAQVEKPYFAVLAFHAPHTPLHAPPDELHSVTLVSSSNPRPFFKAMVEALDTEIGRLLNSLAPSLSNTTVIFMSDNGTPREIIKADPKATLPEDHAKGTTYEGGVNVPLYISGAGVNAPGTECTALVHAVDIFATVADLAGVDLDNKENYPTDRILDSKTLVPFLKDPTHPSLRQINYTEKFFNNTVEAAQVDPTQVGPGPICQPTAESFGTESGPVLSMCGQALVKNSDNETTILLTNAPASAEAFVLMGGLNPGPNPKFGGLTTAIGNTFSRLYTKLGNFKLKKPFTTDKNGTLEIRGVYHQQSTATSFHMQFVIQDPDTNEWMVSNTLNVTQTTNVKAVVNLDGYKLISHISGGPSELYHLPTDPRELTDLLENGADALEESVSVAYEDLRTAIDRQLKTAVAPQKK